MSDGYYNPLWPSGTPVGTDLRPALMPGWFYQSQQTAILRSPLPKGRGLLPCRRLRSGR